MLWSISGDLDAICRFGRRELHALLDVILRQASADIQHAKSAVLIPRHVNDLFQIVKCKYFHILSSCNLSPHHQSYAAVSNAGTEQRDLFVSTYLQDRFFFQATPD